jgi:hypothetical protein
MSSIHKDYAGRFEEEVRRGADPDVLDEIGLGRSLQPEDLIDLDTVADAMAIKRAAAEDPAAGTGDVKLNPPQGRPNYAVATPPSSGPSIDKVTKAMKAAAKKRSKQSGAKPRLSGRQRAIAEGRGEDFNVM